MSHSPARTLVLALGLAWVVCLTPGCEPAKVTAEDEIQPVSQRRTERALPRFEGTGLDGTPLSTDLFRRKRGVIFLYSERDPGSDELAGLVKKLEVDAQDANVAFLGISRDRERDAGQGFARRHGLEFPVLHDPSRTVSRKLGAEQGEGAVIVVDAAGYMLLGFAGVDEEVGIETYEQAVRDSLRLTSGTDAVDVVFGVRPEAPDFTVAGLDGNELSLSELSGKAVAVVFFLHTCPHCHDALEYLSDLRRELATDDLAIVPISVQDSPGGVKAISGRFEDLVLYMDPEGAARKAYAHMGGVPDTLILDREHRVIARHSGLEPRIEALITMEIREALGVPNPILLVKNGHSGQDTCRVCHSGQHETWSLTNHAYAFDTLVQHGSDRDPECLPCHTVGWNEPGGYSENKPVAHLEGVQCENCHGRGGPHQSPEFAANGFESVCVGCHTPEHSLRFDFGERLPLISHAANAQFADLSLEERQALLARRDKRERQLFERADFVGSDACQSCHAPQYELWAQSPHAQAMRTLESQEAAGKAECQTCHTTGFEQPGGFPDGHAVASVGCESCHGPGGNHVGENAAKRGTILALADKCDSCVVLQICGSCHDDANDPGFEFEVLDKIERLRHGLRGDEAAAE